MFFGHEWDRTKDGSGWYGAMFFDRHCTDDELMSIMSYYNTKYNFGIDKKHFAEPDTSNVALKVDYLIVGGGGGWM